MAWLVGLVAVLACGCRIAFDDVASDATSGDGQPTDGLLGHDEDGDGIADSTDTCPMTPDATNVDGDGDGVGDICDSEPGVARQHWAFFSAMTEALPFATGPAGAWTMNGDDFSYIDTASQDQILRVAPVKDVDIWIGLEVEQLGTGGVQVGIIINGDNIPYYYGEIFDGGGGALLSITRYDGNAYIALQSTPLGGAFPLGRTDVYFAARTSPPSFTIAARGKVSSTATASYIGDSLLIFAFGNHSGRVRYIGIVELQ